MSFFRSFTATFGCCFKKTAAEHTCISEERLLLLMKEIFQEEFKKKERNILNISGNFEIIMNEIKNLKQEISELKSRLDFTEDVLEKKVEKLEENIKGVDARVRDIYEYQVDPNLLLEKLAELEDRSRRNNLRIHGINEEKGETWKMCETKNRFFRKN